MSVGNVFFLLCGLISLIGAVSTVVARSAIRSAVGLLVSIVGIAGLFLRLNAQFLAAVQLIVYAGAVVVLFVFVIMLLGPDAGGAPSPLSLPARARWSRWIGGGVFALLAIAAGLLGGASSETAGKFPKVGPELGSVDAVGRQLFMTGLVPFELTTALLIVAVVGAIAVARGRYGATTRKPIEEPKRFFYGPLHPRDAGRPLVKEGAS
jgi:NADH-quinone oxidoreductase subunit J